ncbi:50S ribosomal protein L23 [Patescibacteria group bacterium]|nr:50S ribosomal protein L23 [Patescibacteria group bacterium]
MLKFLKNPFGKKEENTQRKTADKELVDVKDTNQPKAGQRPVAKAMERQRPLAEKKEHTSGKDKSTPKEKPAQGGPSKHKEEKKLEAGYGIILKPHATEKTAASGSFDTYSFIVARRANKIEIKKAFWRMYGIKPTGIRVINMSAKKVNFKRQAGVKPAWKKAYIRVPKDSNISVYEGV